jgi:hypothetical protein
MKILGLHIPGTRDKDKEIELLREELAKADEVAKDLRAQNHALRLDIREYHQAVDRWMAHYDELARDAQRLRLEAINQRQHGKDHSQAQALDPLQQIQELTRGKEHSRVPGGEMKQLAAQKPKQRQGASQANLERIAEAEERRLARESGRNGQAQDQQEQEARQSREVGQALSM